MDNFTYVGIGASAGGLGALKELVSLIPCDEENVYFIAQHLDPDKESALAEILSKHTDFSVQQLSQESQFKAKTIYIIPAGYNLVLKNNRLLLEKAEPIPHRPTPSVDKLFETLALYKKEKSVAILLTGSGHDGCDGMQKIKEHGGITVAQDPQEAEYKSMPQSAIEAGYVDYILTIKEIGDNFLLITYPTLATPLVYITNLLKKHKNFNIAKYKNETILRRINKRMLLVHTKNLEEYAKYIQSHDDEIDLLFENFLIGVTEFFRDKESFSALEEELYLYLKEKPQEYELKLWSIACSTGEEAYSLAIVVDKVSKRLDRTFKVKIFASDIDEKALTQARIAIYPKEALKNFDKEFINAYFTEVEQGYKVIDAIRANILFTKHNILSDPPFVNMDIVSCRNFLIYITQEIQEELFSLFHYALKNDGLLFLGSSESTIIGVKYFQTLDTTHKIYKKEKLQKPPRISPHYFTKHLDKEDATIEMEQSQKLKKSDIEEEIKTSIFHYLAPNCVVIDKELSIIYKKGDLPYLRMPDGFITLNILENLDKSLKYEVKKIISHAFEEKQEQTTKFVEIHHNENSLYIRVTAYPYQVDTNSNMLILYFQELYPNELVHDTQNLNIPDANSVLESLKSQLSDAKDENQMLEKQLLLHREKMQQLTEEIQSSNEELQSSNEELETSNEELQSSNEELHTSLMNEKILQDKLAGILNASQDGIIGLDLDGNHTFVNDAVTKILGFSREELLTHSAHTLWHHTKADGSPYTKEECQLHNLEHNIHSIRTQDLFWKKDATSIDVEVVQDPLYINGKIMGTVLSFHDISEHERLKKEAEYEHEITELYLNTIGTLLMTLDLDGNITMINSEGAKLLGATIPQLIGKNWFDTFIQKNMRLEIKKVFKLAMGKDFKLTQNYKNPIIDLQGNLHQIFWTNHYTKDIDGNITGLLSSGVDITKEEEMFQKILQQEQLYKLTFEEANIGIAHASLDEKWITVNHYLTKLLGYTKEEFQTKYITELTYEEDRESDKQMRQELLSGTLDNYHIEKRFIHKNGSPVWVDLSVVLLKDEKDNPLFFVKIIRDISKMKLLMYELEAEKRKFETIVDFSPVPLLLYNDNGEVLLVNNKFEDTIGYRQSEVSTIDTLVSKLYKDIDAEELIQIKDYYKNPQSQHDIRHSITTHSGDEMVGIFNAVCLYNTDIDAKDIYLVTIVDITDLEKKDELMIAQSRQAAMGEMLAMIAHQWRQPLSVISMLGNNLQLQLELHEEISEEEMRHLIDSLAYQTQYLSQTIDDFRDFFKPDKSKENIKAEIIVKKIKNMMLKSLQDNNIALEVVSMRELEISTYVNQLIQVLLNLISNAKDAIKSNNSVDGLIRLEFKQEGDTILLSVCDNGGGIDKTVLKKLGEPYVSTKSKNGTGLGLYMSIKIVENHLGGTLTWKNSDKGSCFTISLPNYS